MILGLVDVPQQHPEIQQPLVQPFAHVHGVPADDVEPDARIARLEMVGGPRDLAYPIRLAGTDIDVPADGVVGPHDLPLRAVHQLQDLLRPFPQQHALLREGDLPVAPDHQLLAQLLLQLPELPGQGGLGQMQRLGRRRNVLLPGHGQKVLQHSQFHTIHLLVLR